MSLVLDPNNETVVLSFSVFFCLFSLLTTTAYENESKTVDPKTKEKRFYRFRRELSICNIYIYIYIYGTFQFACLLKRERRNRSGYRYLPVALTKSTLPSPVWPKRYYSNKLEAPVYIYICIYVDMYICIYTYLYIHIYTYIYISLTIGRLARRPVVPLAAVARRPADVTAVLHNTVGRRNYATLTAPCKAP